MKTKQGFILVELIAAIVLTSIIAVSTTLFISTGFRGYQDTRNRNEGALSAQMALNRITLELRNLSYFTSVPVESGPVLSFSYRSKQLAGNRTLKYDSNIDTIIINIDGTDYTLLEEVPTFSLAFAYSNLDHDAADEEEVSRIDIGFNLNEIGKDFEARIFPRNLVPKP